MRARGADPPAHPVCLARGCDRCSRRCRRRRGAHTGNRWGPYRCLTRSLPFYYHRGERCTPCRPVKDMPVFGFVLHYRDGCETGPAGKALRHAGPYLLARLRRLVLRSTSGATLRRTRSKGRALHRAAGPHDGFRRTRCPCPSFLQQYKSVKIPLLFFFLCLDKEMMQCAVIAVSVAGVIVFGCRALRRRRDRTPLPEVEPLLPPPPPSPPPPSPPPPPPPSPEEPQQDWTNVAAMEVPTYVPRGLSSTSRARIREACRRRHRACCRDPSSCRAVVLQDHALPQRRRHTPLVQAATGEDHFDRLGCLDNVRDQRCRAVHEILEGPPPGDPADVLRAGCPRPPREKPDLAR